MDKIKDHNAYCTRRIKELYRELDLLSDNLELIPLYTRSALDIDKIHRFQLSVMRDINHYQRLMIGKD